MDIEKLKAYAAVLANVEAINNSGNPNTLSLDEIQRLGSEMLEMLEEK